MSVSSSKEDFLKESLFKYYEKKENITLLSEILTKSKISLRLIDWFITKYSKTHCIHYEMDGRLFYVYSNYKSQLKAYSKKVFDPFCRSQKFTIKKDNITIFSTAGQLNFFRWAIENHVIKFIFKNLKFLEIEMKKYKKAEASKKKEQEDYKLKLNQQITPPNIESINIITNRFKSTVSFD
ncbi:hypothetical protein JO84_gp296 [Aureococcus anophagefferens virus]|uniref:Uncharacterized protein n=1 Tax=Aureococcus anophagefferens virus TaxID=1474867 RepID=A0A076FFD8_9VIRU|nr:hypothetical protein JO84_gp296 [Aureococcus anophagefferens virus]AII16954.1 hypothetical protein AaV_179 [Aureococcus anophagefferens virus]UOG94094.1 hypothetical protein MKD35_53 [Aureococcus anophagefferens virus]